MPEYYYTHQFLLDFLQFLQETLDSQALMTPDLNDIIKYHAVIVRVASQPDDTPMVNEKFNNDVLALMEQLVEDKPLTDDIRHPAAFLFGKNKGKVWVKRLTPEIAELLGIQESPDKGGS